MKNMRDMSDKDLKELIEQPDNPAYTHSTEEVRLATVELRRRGYNESELGNISMGNPIRRRKRIPVKPSRKRG